MADRDLDMRRFRRAADQRLDAAEFLLAHGYHLDAVYLAGYAVECALKSLVLRRTPRNRRDATYEQLTKAGARGHDFEYLRHLLELPAGRHKKGSGMHGVLMVQFKKVSSWSTALRYEARLLKADEAAIFCAAARAIRDWCARS